MQSLHAYGFSKDFCCAHCVKAHRKSSAHIEFTIICLSEATSNPSFFMNSPRAASTDLPIYRHRAASTCTSYKGCWCLLRFWLHAACSQAKGHRIGNWKAAWKRLPACLPHACERQKRTDRRVGPFLPQSCLLILLTHTAKCCKNLVVHEVTITKCTTVQWFWNIDVAKCCKKPCFPRGHFYKMHDSTMILLCRPAENKKHDTTMRFNTFWITFATVL